MSIAQNFPAISPSLNLSFALTKTLDQRITFARATTGTYYGTRTALAEQNLVLQSETFDTASWTKTNGTVTADAIAAPDGTTTADLFTENTATGVHTLQASGSSIANQPMVFSAFIKPNGRTVVRLDWENNDSFYVLATLTSGGTINGGSGTVTALADGWYRLALTTTPTLTTSAFRIRLCESATGAGVTSYTGDGTSGIYVWGAQLEQRSAVTAYTPTTTQPISNYIPVLETAASGVARFDHNPTTFESLGLLVEQQSTNLALYSEQFDNAYWTKNNVTISANQIIAPDGMLAADTLTANVGASFHYVNRLAGITTSGSNTFSFYVKKGTATWIFFGVTDVSLNFFNLDTGAFGSTPDACSVQVVGNGWYKISVIRTLTTATCAIGIAGSSSGASFTATGFETIYIWGAQLEAAAFSTSYIQTVASQVTRAADAASITGTNFSSWYAQGEGTLYVESLSQNTTAANPKNLRLSDGTTSNELWLGGSSPGTSARSQIFLGGVTYFDSSLANQVTAGQFGKYAVSFETNNAVLCANGTLGTVDTAVPISSAINQFAISPPGLRAGYYKKIAYYPIAVTSAQLQALTG